MYVGQCVCECMYVCVCRLDGKVSAYNAGDPGSIPRLGKSSRESSGTPLQVLLPGESHGQRSLVGCSPWGHKESDTTERLHCKARVESGVPGQVMTEKR